MGRQFLPQGTQRFKRTSFLFADAKAYTKKYHQQGIGQDLGSIYFCTMTNNKL
jgi:hypothetical protein